MPILLPERGDATGFGEFLRGARERRGLTLQQISNETKIPWRHLDALERGNLAAVPAGMYRRAEIRAYAAAVGIDQGVALAELEHALEMVKAPAEVEEVKSPLSRKLLDHGVTLGVVAVIVLMAAAGVLWSRSSNNSSAAAAAPAALTPSASDPGAPTRSEPATAPAIADAPQPSAPAPASRAAATTATASTPSVETATALPVDPASATAPGELVITTEPGGARVMVDGIGRGSTPATIRHLGAGPKRIRVIKDGYVSEERVVTFSPERGQTVAIPMQRVQ